MDIYCKSGREEGELAAANDVFSARSNIGFGLHKDCFPRLALATIGRRAEK